MRKEQFGLVLALLALVGAAPMFATPITIANPSFETCPTCVDPGSGFTMINTPSTALTGWAVVSGDIQWAWAYTATSGWTSADLNHSLDMNGSTAGAIQQSVVDLLPGNYSLTFKMSGAPGGAPPLERDVALLIQVKNGVLIEATNVFTYHVGPTNSRLNMNWASKTWDFTLANASDTLVIASQEYGDAGAGTPFGPAIDLITLDRHDEGVPEPGTLSMFLGAGLLAVAGIARRRTR